MQDKDVNVIAIQETHTSSDVNLHQCGEMPGYRLIGAIHRNIHGIVTY
jgi:hypothetical protein